MRKRTLVDADTGRSGQVHRLGITVDGHANRGIGEREMLIGEATCFVTEQPGGGLGEGAGSGDAGQVVTLDVGGQNVEAGRAGSHEHVVEFNIDRDGHVKDGSGRGTHNFRVVEVDGSARDDDGVGTGSIGHADDRAEVSRVAHLFENHHELGCSPVATFEDVFERRGELSAHRDDALRRDRYP